MFIFNAIEELKNNLPIHITKSYYKTDFILFPGNNKKHPSSIPDNLPEFPDSHSYIRTPTHRQPVTDYEMVREKAASQKRDVERALTRFIAKTGKIHNLYRIKTILE